MANGFEDLGATPIGEMPNKKSPARKTGFKDLGAVPIRQQGFDDLGVIPITTKQTGFEDLGAVPVQPETQPETQPGLIRRGLTKLITPIPLLEKGREIIAARLEQPETLLGTLAAVERRLVPEALRAGKPLTVMQETARVLARATIPLPSPKLIRGIVEIFAPVTPLDLATDAVLPFLSVASKALKTPVKNIAAKIFSKTGEVTRKGSQITLDITKEAFEEAKKLDNLRRVKSRTPEKVFPKIQTEKGLLVNPGPVLARVVDDAGKIVDGFKKSIPEIAANPEKVIAFTRGRQITDIIIDSIEDGTIPIQKGAELLGIEVKAGEATLALTTRLREAATKLGQGLNRLSQASRAFRDFLKDSPELAKSLDDALLNVDVNQTLGRRLLQPIANVSNEVIQTWRGIIISQPGTAVRNFITQSGRATVGIFDDALNGTMRFLSGAEPFEKAFSNVTEDIIGFFSRLSPTKRAQLEKLLDLFPTQKTLLSSNRFGDLTLSNRFVKMLNFLNTGQEDFFRKAAFDARLRSNLTRLGKSVDDLPNMLKTAQGSKVAKKLIDDSVEHALQMTFAANPQGAFGKAFLKIHDAAPILYVIGFSFPRFWLNVIRFTTEFSPLGVMFTRTATKNPELAFRGLSRAMTGTLMFSGAVAIRNSKFAGDKWFEIRPDPDNDPGRTIDGRNMQPFIATLFVADLVKRMQEIKNGERIELGYSPADLSNALLAMRRTDFGGLPLLDNFVFNRGDLTDSKPKMMKTLIKMVGEFLAGFATPFRSYRQIVIGGTEIIRATREAPLFGPFLAQIAGVREKVLPPLPSITRPGPKLREEVRKRQFPGIAIKTKTPVESAIDKADINEFQFAPRTGDEEANRLARAKMGEAVDLLIGELIKGKDFNKLIVDDRKEILLEELRGIRDQAIKEVREERPDIDIRLRVAKEKPGPRRILQPLIKDLRLTPPPAASLEAIKESISKRLRSLRGSTEAVPQSKSNERPQEPQNTPQNPVGQLDRLLNRLELQSQQAGPQFRRRVLLSSLRFSKTRIGKLQQILDRLAQDSSTSPAELSKVRADIENVARQAVVTADRAR